MTRVRWVTPARYHGALHARRHQYDSRGHEPARSLDGKRWIACRPGFFLPVRVLWRLFRRLVLEKLAAAHGAGALQFFGKHATLTHAQTFAAYLAPLRNSEWVVYSKRPFAGPAQVLRHLARYTHRVALSYRRLVA